MLLSISQTKKITMIISNNNQKYTRLKKKYTKFETQNMTPNIMIKWKKADKINIVDTENKNISILLQAFLHQA